MPTPVRTGLRLTLVLVMRCWPKTPTACTNRGAILFPEKTISLYVGNSVGGGYDLYARLLARHMAKYMPGTPTIVPKNMEGGGSLRAANFMFNCSPQRWDGVRNDRPGHRIRSSDRAAGRNIRCEEVHVDRQR